MLPMMVPVLVAAIVAALMLSTRLLWGDQPTRGRVLAATVAGIVASVLTIMVIGGAEMSQASLIGVSVVMIVLAAAMTFRGTHREPDLA